MPHSRSQTTLGEKLGPKLIAAVTQSVIATKKGLMPTEHALRVNSMQTVIDRAGHEIADLHSPFIDQVLSSSPDLHPVVKTYLQQIASGRDQWQAIAGNLALSSAVGGLGTVITNTVAPVVQHLVELTPNIHVDQNAAAQATARALVNQNEGATLARQAGYDGANFELLVGISATVPPPDVLFDLFNRGLLSRSDVIYWLRRNGFPQGIVDTLFNMHKAVLTPADAALGALRGNISQDQGVQIALESGYSSSQFQLLLDNTGEPPGPQQLLEAYRRGFIDKARLARGIRQSRIRNEWLDVVEALRFTPMSPADAIEAAVKGYIHKDQAQHFAAEGGLEPSQFPILLEAAGEPLSRTEMADLVNRGEATVDEFRAAIRQSRTKDVYVEKAVHLIQRPMSVDSAVRGYVQGYISEAEANRVIAMNGIRPQDIQVLKEIEGVPLSLTELLRLHRMGKLSIDEVKQGLRESRLKDKYIDVALDLTLALPSIFELRLLLHDGAISDAEASRILLEHGYAPDVVKGIVHAFSSAGSGASKAITEGMLTELYLESAIDGTEFLAALASLGYSKANAALIKELADWRIELSQRNALVSHVRTMYVGRKISETEAQSELQRNNVPHAIIDRVMEEWNAEIRATGALLTVAQIADAWQLNLFDDTNAANNTAQAVKQLKQHAYSEADSLLILQIKHKGPLGS